MSRRFVFGVVAAVLAVMVLGGILVWVAGGDGSRTAALEESRRSSDFSWQLYGGGTFWADLESVAGCDVRGEVATVTDAATGETGKHIAGVVPSPCRLQVAINSRVNSALYVWINNALSETHTRRNLTLLKRPTSTSGGLGIDFENALIERVELPAFNAADTSAAPVTVTLTIRPEQTTRDDNPALPNPPSGSVGTATTRSFGVDVGTGALGVSRFEPWSAAVEITRSAGVSDTGATLPLYQATTTSLGDLELSIPVASGTGSDLSDLHNWFQDLVVDNEGFPDPSEERTLTLTARNPQSGAVLLTVTFTNVGIFAQPSYALGNNPEKFLFYAEGVSFAGVAPAAAPPPPPPPPVAPPPPPPPPDVAMEIPPAPANVKAVVDGTVVVLSWEAVEAKYEVLLGKESGGPYEQIAATEAPTAKFELPDGVYYIVVRAATAEGGSPNSDEVVVRIGRPPISLSAVVEGTVVILSWEPIEAVYYEVLYGREPGGPYEQVTQTEESTAKFELPEPGTYYVVVRGVPSEEVERASSNEVAVEISP
jgi:hypothetical protein